LGRSVEVAQQGGLAAVVDELVQYVQGEKAALA
jgi:hypothetical protein